jgi:hypothetical protein
LISHGFFKAADPLLYREYFDALKKANSMQNWSQTYADLVLRYKQSDVADIANSIGALGYLILNIWGFIGWGAFRQLNGLSKLRSSVALIITLVLFVPVFFISIFIGAIEHR